MSTPDQLPKREPVNEPRLLSQQNLQLPPQQTPAGQWVFVPTGQSFILGSPAGPADPGYGTVPGYQLPPRKRSVGIRIGAGVVALSNLVLAIPSFIYVMGFVYGDPMTPAEGWANFFVLVAIICSLVSGIRLISKRRLPTAGSTTWTLAGFALLGTIGFIAMAAHYPTLTVIWSVLTGITVIVLCLTDVSKTANMYPSI